MALLFHNNRLQMYVAFENDSAGTATPSTTAEEKGYALFFFLPLCQLTGVGAIVIINRKINCNEAGL